MTTIGTATLQIIPSMAGVTEAVNKQLGGLPAMGKAAGKQLGDGIAAGVDAAAKQVEQAAGKVAAARNKEADAAGKVRVAEAQLATLREKGVTDAGRLTAAEEKITKATRDHETASKNLAKTAKEEASAQDKLAEAKKRVEKASDGATAGGGRFSGMIGGLKAKLGEASGGIDGLGGKVKGLGSTLASNLGLGVAGGIAGIGASLIAMGDQFAQVNKTLSFTTGATGAALDAMNASVRTIAKSSPVAMTDIAESIAGVAKATQLTGKPLEDMTARVMKLGRMGQNVDVASLTQSMRAFGVPAEEMSGQLDNIYRAAAASGMGVGDLAGMALKGAPQFKAFGLSMDDTVAMMGNLYKSGVRGEAVTVGLNKAMIALSKGGGDVKVKFKDAVGQMDAMIKAGNTSGATEMAGKLFGTKSAGQFIKAIQEGKLNLDEMNGALDKQRNGIMDAGGAVPTMAGAWQLLKNNVMIELEPIVTKIFKAMTDGILWFRTEGVGIIQGFKSNLDWIAPIAAGVGAMVLAWKAWTTAIIVWNNVTKAAAVVQAAFNVVMDANPIGLIVLAVIGLGTALVVAYKRSETFRNIVDGAWKAIKDTVGAIVSWFTDTVWPALKKVWEAVGDGWTWLVTKAQEVWTGVRDKFTAMVDWFRGLPDAITNAAKGMWEGLKVGLVAVLNWISGKWNSFADSFKVHVPGTDIDVGLPHLPTFGGGGYTGSMPIDKIAGVVHGGEYVVQSESRRRIENAFPGLLDYLNNNGRLPLPGYSGGGRVPYGLPAGTNTGGYGSSGAVFPDWVHEVEKRFGVKASTYPGHQERSGLNKGIDWVGSIDAMQRFAEYLKSNRGDLEQVIWMNPRTGEKIGVADGQLVGPGTPQAGYYSKDWGGHQNHVHTRQSYSFFGGSSEKAKDDAAPAAATSADQTPATADVTAAASSSGTSSASVPSSISGWSSFGLDNLGVKTQVTPGSPERTFEFGKAASAAVGGQVQSALGVFGVPDSPGWLQGISKFVGGISIGGKSDGAGQEGGSSAAPIAATSLPQAPDISNVQHGNNAGQQPGPPVTYNIAARDTEDAFIRAQRQERERAAAKLSRF